MLLFFEFYKDRKVFLSLIRLFSNALNELEKKTIKIQHTCLKQENLLIGKFNLLN